jgi:hypothetical protein
MALAANWEAAAPEMPREVAGPLREVFGEVRLVAAFPEWKVSLPGGRRASQTDLLALVYTQVGLVIVAVEGKVDEEFGPTVEAKRTGASPGQEERLDYLAARLGLERLPDGVRYQLCHRTVSALDTAKEFHAAAAVMLVQSFSTQATWYEDFAAFATTLGVMAEKERLLSVPRRDPPSLYLAWVNGDLAGTRVDLR